MSIRSFRLIWLKLQIGSKRSFPISIPIPLFVLQELLDCLLDLLTIANLFAPKKTIPFSSSHISISSAKMLVIMIMKLLDSIAGNEPYDLIDVTADEVRVLITVR